MTKGPITTTPPIHSIGHNLSVSIASSTEIDRRDLRISIDPPEKRQEFVLLDPHAGLNILDSDMLEIMQHGLFLSPEFQNQDRAFVSKVKVKESFFLGTGIGMLAAPLVVIIGSAAMELGPVLNDASFLSAAILGASIIGGVLGASIGLTQGYFESRKLIRGQTFTAKDFWLPQSLLTLHRRQKQFYRELPLIQAERDPDVRSELIRSGVKDF